MPKPLIFNYLDFRAYLKDFLSFLRESNKAFSFQYLIDTYGLKSRSHWLDIINGRRLTDRFIPSYIEICGLKDDEAQYFRAIVGYAQADTEGEKERHFREIVRLSPTLTPVRLEDEAYRYFEHWYHPALISLLDIMKTEKDHRVLAESLSPAISAVACRKALTLLADLGFVLWDDAKKEWVLQKKFFQCTDAGYAAALKRFHKQLFDLGRKAYEEHFDKQLFSSLTLSVTQDTKKEIAAIIAESRKRILDLARKDESADRVVQVNFQIFEMSTIKRKKA